MRDTSGVLFIVNGLGIGGSERKTVTVVNELHRAGWDVHLAYLADRTAGLDRLDKDVPLVHLGRKGKFSVTAYGKLRKYILARQIRRIVCVNLYPLLYANAAILWLKPSDRPKISLTINTTQVVGLKANAQMTIYRPLIRNADRVAFGCQAQLALWCNRYRIERSKCCVIYNGVDETRFKKCEFPREAVEVLDVDPSAFVIGAVGQLRHEKNHIELIRVMDRLKDALPESRLIVVGHGPEHSYLEQARSASASATRISFLGQMPDIRGILSRMDVFVLPSITETFSNAVLEAMSMGVPVILSDTGGSREMVDDAVNGFIYEQGNIDALASIILHLASDSALRSRLAESGRDTVLKRFTYSKMIDGYKKFLQ